MIGEVSEADGIGGHAEDVEGDLEGLRALFGFPEALHDGGGAADDEGFSEGEFEDAKQDEEEVDRHGGFHAGEADLHGGGEDGNEEIAGEAEEVTGVPVEAGRGKDGRPEGSGKEDEDSGSDWCDGIHEFTFSGSFNAEALRPGALEFAERE